MTDYAKTATRADQSLRRKGGIVSVRRIVLGTDYNPDTGTAVALSDTTLDGTGVKIAYDASDIDGTLIMSGDQKLLLSPLQRNGAPMPTPITSDTVLIGGSTYRIQSIGKLEPTDVAVLFTLQLRGL